MIKAVLEGAYAAVKILVGVFAVAFWVPELFGFGLWIGDWWTP